MIEQIVEKHLSPGEDFIFGFASLAGLLPGQFSDYPYGISIGKRLNRDIVDAIQDGPTLEYYDHYLQMNHDLQVLSENIAEDLRKSGHEVLSFRPSVTTQELDITYQQSLRTPLSHKMVATRAGLGWIGKTDLFISFEFGPRLRLVSLLTKTPLPVTKPTVDASQCGPCSVCVDECPASAATGQLWDISIDRDQFFDAQKCRAQCRKFGEEKLKRDIRICGICVAVCPLGF